MACETNIFYVYLHRRKDDNEVFYVGKGSKGRAKNTWSRSDWWKSVVAKHGLVIEYIETNLSEESAFDLEVEMIRFYRENGHPLVNITEGGTGASGNKHSEEAKEKIRKSSSGRLHSEESKKKISAVLTNRPCTEETRQKMRLNRLGKPLSKESIRKRSLALKIPIECSNGLIFKSATDAAEWLREMGFPKAYSSAICNCCKGVVKSSYGFIWKYYIRGDSE